LLLDGLDEIYRVDPNFVGLLGATQQAGRRPGAPGSGVVVLCAGRSEPASLEDALRATSAAIVFDGGLRGLTPDATRALLTAHLERLKYQLFARDEPTDGGESWSNPFIEALARKSDGLPLYLAMLVDDLKAGRRTVSGEKELPTGLIAYYDEILDRSK